MHVVSHGLEALMSRRYVNSLAVYDAHPFLRGNPMSRLYWRVTLCSVMSFYMVAPCRYTNAHLEQNRTFTYNMGFQSRLDVSGWAGPMLFAGALLCARRSTFVAEFGRLRVMRRTHRWPSLPSSFYVWEGPLP